MAKTEDFEIDHKQVAELAMLFLVLGSGQHPTTLVSATVSVLASVLAALGGDVRVQEEGADAICSDLKIALNTLAAHRQQSVN